MDTAQNLRDRARALRALANDQATTEAALVLRSRAAWLEHQADRLGTKEPATPASQPVRLTTD